MIVIRIVELAGNIAQFQQWDEHRGGWVCVPLVQFDTLPEDEQRQLTEQREIIQAERLARRTS